ncbi:NAD-dependent epimerase/dehydratase family protein [Pyrobaculum ferrireducens]|uniref:NAD-dependent epimerase/dehydratase n=1 Tax=Pyrobaculum ferrireducens TaxID=1104324 RepID=G7VID4_9CREN|nr:NAD-dependent epimerase/dehydratase [Pyrobaculum ferrireducens]
MIDNLSSGRLENLRHLGDSVEVIIGDLKRPEDALRAVDGVDSVFHFAVNPEVRVSTTNPETHFNENVVAIFNLLEAMRRRGVKELVFASSSSVYGEPVEIPVSEGALIRPVSVYGASKAACENLIHAYTRLYGIKAVALRYANVVRPRLRHGVVWDFMNKLRANPRELEVLGDGTQVRSYIYIDDAVEATILAWKKTDDAFSIFNVASEDWITVDEVAKIVIEIMGLKDVKIIHKPVAHGVGWLGDVKKIALKIDQLKALGFKPKLNSAQAIEKTVNSMMGDFVK